MHPALPDEPTDGEWITADEVGEFEQGTPLSRWALARYLVGRAIGESVGRFLLIAALVVLALAAAGQWGLRSTWLGVGLAVLAVLVLLVRAALLAVLHRLTATQSYRPLEERLRALVKDTSGDVLRELRRVGLPSHTVTLPLLAFRLAGRRRTQTLARIREVDLDRVVPRSRVDELHLLLRQGMGRG